MNAADTVQSAALAQFLARAKSCTSEQRAALVHTLRSMIRRHERCRIDATTWADLDTMTAAADAMEEHYAD